MTATIGEEPDPRLTGISRVPACFGPPLEPIRVIARLGPDFRRSEGITERQSLPPALRIAPLPLAIANRHSNFGNSGGGIAQLVERQLCKLDVRGSNPLASMPQPLRG